MFISSDNHLQFDRVLIRNEEIRLLLDDLI